MSTTPITHRPISFVTAAAVALALAAGGVALSALSGTGHPSAPGQHSFQHQAQANAPQDHRVHPTTSGGRVLLGQ